MFIASLFGIGLLLASSGTASVPSYSQASQDRFVHLLLYEILDKQDEGYYLEIGAGPPISCNNSYLFEKNFGWKGVSLDISDAYQNGWLSNRQNPLLIEDAEQADYGEILKPFPPQIDYLSLDVDANYDTILQRISFDEHTFKVITVEHDFYRFGDRFRKEERRILESLGYYLLCPDVSNDGLLFEDWWIYPGAFPADLFSRLTSLDLKEKNHGAIIHAIEEDWWADKTITNPLGYDGFGAQFQGIIYSVVYAELNKMKFRAITSGS